MNHERNHALLWMSNALLLTCTVACADGAPEDLQAPLASSVSDAAVTASQIAPQKNTSLCLTASSLNDGAPVVLRPCSSSSNQLWATSGNTITLGSNKCLDVVNGNHANGTRVQLYTCYSGNTNQAWTFDGNSWIWVGTGMCLDVTNGVYASGTPIQVWACAKGNVNQMWTSNPVSSPQPQPQPSSCNYPYQRSVPVSTSVALQTALDNAKPGDGILLADGTYSGNFVAKTVATSQQPIILCGSQNVILQGVNAGYPTLYLNGAAYWTLANFSVQRGQKGILLDAASHNTLQSLRVSNTGNEGIHLRTNSTYNTIDGSEVFNTGQAGTAKLGEGIYVGSATGDWGTYTGGLADRCDNNVLSNNTIHNTTAENIDIKEGTSGGQIINNKLNGATIDLTGTNSVVNVKGNSYVVRGNAITQAPEDALSVHVILPGWGACNAFSNNSEADSLTGYGVHVATPSPQPVTSITSDNSFPQATKGLSNAKLNQSLQGAVCNAGQGSVGNPNTTTSTCSCEGLAGCALWTKVYMTYYGFNDNSCTTEAEHGCNDIAYPGLGPKKHTGATEGAGTYDDPITAAASDQGFETSGGATLKPGTIIYNPSVQKYFIMEDSCLECGDEWNCKLSPDDTDNPPPPSNCKAGTYLHIDFWMGPSFSQDVNDLNACEDNSTIGDTYNGTGMVLINPPSNLPVRSGLLYSGTGTGGSCWTSKQAATGTCQP